MSDDLQAGFCPYKGLQPYTEADRAYFFGRERDQEIIASNLYAAPLTVLYGASGVGKSSVLLAGVVPKLRKTPRLAIVVFRDWQNPEFQSELKAELRREIERSLGKPCAADDSLPFDDFLAACARSLRGPVFFLLDQFEEYFLYHGSGDGENGFDVAFARAINREEIGVNFMLSMREDGISKLDRFQGRIPNLLANLLRLEYLDREAATRAIRRPLDEYNRRLPAGQAPIVIEDKLVEALLRDLQTGRVSLDQAGQGQAGMAIPADARIETPFLQLVLTRLWQEETAGGSNALRLVTLDRLGGTENIARTHLDTAMEELSESERDVAARMFRFLVTPSGSKIAQDLASLAAWSEVSEETARAILLRLTSGTRILRTVSAAGQADLYEIFHDVLAPAILDWRRRYVQAQDLREAEKQAAEQRKRADEQARAATRLRLLAGALAVVTLLVLAVAVFAFRAQRTAVAAEKKAVDAQHEANERRNAAVRAEGRATDASAKAEREKRRAEHQARLAAQRAEEALTAKTEADLAKATAEEQRANAEKQERIATSRELAAAADRNRNELGILLAMEAVKATYAFDGTVTNEARDILAQAAEGAKVKLNLPGHQGKIAAVTYSPDGNRIATQSEDGILKVWDAASVSLVSTLEWPGPSFRNPGIAFSKDGQRVAAGSWLDIDVRDVSTGAKRLSAHGARGSIIEKFALSPDGESLATVSTDENVRLWRSPDGTEPLVFEDETAIRETQRAEVAFSSDGARLIILRPKRVTVIDASTSAVLRTFPFQAPNDGLAALSADGNHFAISLGDDMRIWNVETGREVAWKKKEGFLHIAFSLDGSRLVGASDTDLVVWEVGSGARVLERSRDRIGPMAISPKGDRIAFSPGDTSFSIINVADGNSVLQSWGAQEMKMWGVAFSADGRRVAATSDKGVLRVWETASGRETSTALAPSATAIAISPDAKTVAAVKENDGTVALYDSATGKLLRSLPVQQSSLFRAAFSPDGSKLVTVGYDHGPKFFDVASGKELSHLQEPNGAFNLTFSKDGRRLATGGRDSCSVWDIASKPERRIQTIEMLGNEVAFTPDGQRLVVVSDHTTAVFDVSSGERLYEVTGGVKRDLWHQGAIGVAFSPDGRLLATVQENLTVKVWDAENGTEQMTLYGHGGAVRGISFSTDGSKLIAVSEDWTTHAHPLRIEDLMTLARSRVKRELTVDERRKYLHQP